MEFYKIDLQAIEGQKKSGLQILFTEPFLGRFSILFQAAILSNSGKKPFLTTDFSGFFIPDEARRT